MSVPVSYLDDLDENQKRAVMSPDGWVRVRAGAGTGKTRTLTARVESLIRLRNVPPSDIMILTFTNKSAREIRERLLRVLGSGAYSITMGTFHSVASRIIRRHYERCGLESSDFVIIDEDEVAQIMQRAYKIAIAADPEALDRAPGESASMHKERQKQLQQEYDVERKAFLAEAIPLIARWKESGVTISYVTSPNRDRRGEFEEKVIALYIAYQRILEDSNYVDFTDIILKNIELFEDYPNVVEEESNRWKHILVDEFQDTNPLQYRWLKHVSSAHGNLFVVGDPDQSIYAFRGSSPRIMETMHNDNEWGVFDVSLVHNRRSTDDILGPANLLVDMNPRSDQKILVSGIKGKPPKVVPFENDFSEANGVASAIRKLHATGVAYEDIAILVRSSYALSTIEDGIRRQKIPYHITGAMKFLEREEIKDVIAYLRLAVNPYDDLAFGRIANKPVRGLGPAASDYIRARAISLSIPFHEACLDVAMSDKAGGGPRMKDAVKQNLKIFANLLNSIFSMYSSGGVKIRDIMSTVIQDTGYRNDIIDRYKNEERKRDAKLDNLKRLAADADGYSNLSEFLQQLALEGDTSGTSEEGRPVGVALSTIHAAKGLEFDHVFLPAFEEGLIPSSRALDEGAQSKDPWVSSEFGGMEEERRIAHVAMTRAKKSIQISWCKLRNKRRARPSPFLAEAQLVSRSYMFNASEDSDHIPTYNQQSSVRPMGFSKTNGLDKGRQNILSRLFPNR